MSKSHEARARADAARTLREALRSLKCEMVGRTSLKLGEIAPLICAAEDYLLQCGARPATEACER